MTHTRQNSEKLKNAFKSTARFTVSPLKLSVDLINTKSQSMDYDFSGVPHLVGWLSLPWTAAATAITLPVGLIGMGLVLGAATIAMPVAVLQDTFSSEENIKEYSANISSKTNQSDSSDKSIFNQLEKKPGEPIRINHASPNEQPSSLLPPVLTEKTLQNVNLAISPQFKFSGSPKDTDRTPNGLVYDGNGIGDISKSYAKLPY